MKDLEEPLSEIAEQAKDEGIEPGSPDFDKRIRQLKVIKCREMRGLYSCSECEAFDYCELVKQVLRDNRGL